MFVFDVCARVRVCARVCVFFFCAPLKASIVKQQGLFKSKVIELASSARRISLLEDSVAKHLARQRNLDEQLQVTVHLSSTVEGGNG